MAEVQRLEGVDGSVVIAADGCIFRYERPRPGVVHVRIAGVDSGQFGDATMTELRRDLLRYPPVEVFFDVTGAPYAAVVPVQDAWTVWFRDQRPALRRVNILVAGKYMEFTMEVAKLFSRTNDLIRIYLDPAAFEEALAQASRSRA